MVIKHKVFLGLALIIMLSCNLSAQDFAYNYLKKDKSSSNLTITQNITQNYYNITGDGMFVPYTGANQTVNLNGQTLTNVGELIMTGLIQTRDIIPELHNIYTLGNSTHWWKEIFVKDIYAENLSATTGNIDNVNSENVNSNDVNSDRVNSTNVTIGGYEFVSSETELTLKLK